MRRCKLISPTNLMLETPILSPVEECEYVLHGMREYQKDRRDWMIVGLMAGTGFGIVISVLLFGLRCAQWH